MRTLITRQKATGAAIASAAGAAGCGVEALRLHLWLSSLGPICGLDRPGQFFNCPACPIGLALLTAAFAFGGFALRCPVAVRAAAVRSDLRTPS